MTRELPKPLLPVAGRPLLEYMLEHLASQGVGDVAVNLHFLGPMIREAMGDGARMGVRIHYFDEEASLGTAGAVANASAFLQETEACLVVYGDLLTNQPLAPLLERHREHDADATLLVHRRPWSNSRVRLAGDGRIVEFRERPADVDPDSGPTWVNSGFQLLSRRLVEEIAAATHPSPYDLPRDVYEPLHGSRRFYGVPLSGYRCAIDSIERYALANADVITGKLRSR